jgi:hypothetical protein
MHWIYMAGLRGCLPDLCGVSDNREDAVGEVSEIMDLSPAQENELRENGLVDWGIQYGPDYVSVTPCNCSTPEVHNGD